MARRAQISYRAAPRRRPGLGCWDGYRMGDRGISGRFWTDKHKATNTGDPHRYLQGGTPPDARSAPGCHTRAGGARCDVYVALTPQQQARAQENKAAALQRRAEVAELRPAAARRRQWRRMERRRARAERWPELVARARRWRPTAPAEAGPVLNGPATRRRVGHRMVVRPRAAALAAWARRVRRRGRRAAQHDEQADSPARDATMCSSPHAASRDNAGVAGDSVQRLWWRRQQLLRLPPQLRSGVARAARSDCEGMKHASAR